MKSSNSLLTIGVAAIMLVAASSLHAQVTPVAAANAAPGDLILGFSQSQSGTTGFASNIEVDLGAYSQFATYTGGAPTLFVVTNLGADLSSTYGSTWDASASLKWGVVRAGGTADSSHPDAIIGKANSNPFAGATTPYVIGSTNSVQNPAKALNNGTAQLLAHDGSFPSGYSGIKNPPYTSSNNSSAAIVPTINSTSWTTVGINPGQVFNAGSVNTDFTTANFEQGTNFSLSSPAIINGYYVEDLYQLHFVSSGNVTETYVGSIGLNSDGAVVFANSDSAFSAVPEPSTYAAIAGVLALGLAAYRRHSRRGADGAMANV